MYIYRVHTFFPFVSGSTVAWNSTWIAHWLSIWKSKQMSFCQQDDNGFRFIVIQFCAHVMLGPGDTSRGEYNTIPALEVTVIYKRELMRV